MGAYSPLDWAPADLVEHVTERVLQPTVDEMAERGTPFVGLLYAGLALTSRGLRVVEFNARFGDPETQVVLARLRNPLGRCCTPPPPARWTWPSRCTGATAPPSPSWSPPSATRATPRTGDPINGLADAEDAGGRPRDPRRAPRRPTTVRWSAPADGSCA